ncbi:unnamed protein product [Toxocara canis]|uniref:Tetratricopeptide repeat (TPR)-like superfamily protein n=1 Tax=Toxocara canis TaxID=6265 RepID=A0A183TXT5_TOXCA|nr:unnamed protein product [Toxocara canis]
MDDFVDVERVLDTLNWQNCHQETLTVLFDRALNVYPYGNQTLADFAVMAFLAAFRDGNVDAACKYMRHIIDMREAGFGDRANHLLASAHFAFAIFLYIRMRSASSSCKVEQFQSIKRHAYEARQLFRILYGEGSVRDFELDFMLSEARRAVAQ